jgi:ABC-2 type transport system permease protein
MQLVYLVVPMVYIAVNRGAGSAILASLLGPAAVYVSTSLAGSLAWITVAAEDAPDLLRSAPVSLSRLRWAKAMAALLPAWLLAVPALVVVADTSLSSIPALVFCLAGSTVSTVGAQVWFPVQAQRAELVRRKPGRGAVSLIAGFVTFAWVVSAFCLIQLPAYAAPALLAAALGSGAIWCLGRARRAEEGGVVEGTT